MRAKRFLALLLAVLALPLTASAGERNPVAVADALLTAGDRLVATYDPSNGIATSDEFSTLYFEIFEGKGLEAAIGRRDAGRKAELESYFSGIISAAARNAPPADIRAAWDKLRQGLCRSGRWQRRYLGQCLPAVASHPSA